MMIFWGDGRTDGQMDIHNGVKTSKFIGIEMYNGGNDLFFSPYSIIITLCDLLKYINGRFVSFQASCSMFLFLYKTIITVITCHVAVHLLYYTHHNNVYIERDRTI